jgi:hypothetical protein
MLFVYKESVSHNYPTKLRSLIRINSPVGTENAFVMSKAFESPSS